MSENDLCANRQGHGEMMNEIFKEHDELCETIGGKMQSNNRDFYLAVGAKWWNKGATTRWKTHKGAGRKDETTWQWTNH